MSIQALREKRAAKAKALHELASKEAWNAEADQPIYDAGMLELDSIDAQIKRINDLNERTAKEAIDGAALEAANRVSKDKGVNTSVFAKWLKDGDKGISAEEWQSIRNTMSTTTNSEGGFTVPQEWAKTALEALKAYGGMRSVADVIQTAGVGQLNYPTTDGTTEEGEIIGENTTATDLDISFGTKPLTAFKYSSKVVTVPFELLQDSAIDVEALVRARLVSRLGRITNKHFTIGTGTGQPTGIDVAATIGVTATTGNTTAVTYDFLVNLQHSVDPAYRESGNMLMMMHDNTLREIRKIKDSQSRPIFVPGYETGSPGGPPDTVLGTAAKVNQDMPVMAANAKSILFGDFSYYKIRDVMTMELFRFTDSAFTKKGQVGFLAWMRSGGNFIDVGGAVKAYANSAT